MALFTADPTPEFCLGTEVISAVVRGATSSTSPIPNTTNAGNRSVQYEVGGKSRAGAIDPNTHPWVVEGIRANHRTPRPITAGPAAMKMREPYRAASFPNRVENRARNSV